jgi:hypothetical protein
MRTKITSFVLALGLAAMACTITGPASRVQENPTIEVQVHLVNFTSTPTTEPSPTDTNTPVPPTATRTLVLPTSTPTSLGPMLKVIGNDAVNIRSGPCNQPILTQATPGMQFPLSGRYTSPGDENWWRIQVPTQTGALIEGWIWGGRVEVTGESLVPLVGAQCPSFATATPTNETVQTETVTKDHLGPDQQLGLDEVLTSADGRFTLVMQSDSNLVLYRNGVGALWASGTVGTGAIRAVMQSDGNLVLYTANNTPVWASNTVGGGSILLLQNDGNLVIYREGAGAVWASNTVS